MNRMQSVTDTKCATGDAFDSRNGEEPDSLEEAAACINAIAASSPFAPTEAQWEKIKLASKAQENCDSCGKCGRNLAKDETVWRMRMGMGRAFFGGNGFTVAPVCEQCRPRYHSYLPERPCEHCSRAVINEDNGRRWYRKHTYCSEQCAEEHGSIILKSVRAQRRQQREYVCRVCDKPFKPSRRDALHCSSACRQRDYRNRQREVSKKHTEK